MVTLHACHCFGTSVGLEDYNSWDPSYPRGYQESGEPDEPLVSRRLEGFPFAVCQLAQQLTELALDRDHICSLKSSQSLDFAMHTLPVGFPWSVFGSNGELRGNNCFWHTTACPISVMA